MSIVSKLSFLSFFLPFGSPLTFASDVRLLRSPLTFASDVSRHLRVLRGSFTFGLTYAHDIYDDVEGLTSALFFTHQFISVLLLIDKSA